MSTILVDQDRAQVEDASHGDCGPNIVALGAGLSVKFLLHYHSSDV